MYFKMAMSPCRSTENPNRVIIFLVSALLGMLVIMLSILTHGFDITDEGFYLATIENPILYRQSVSQFGFLLKPLWLLSGKNVVSLRLIYWVGMLVTSFYLFFLLLKSGVVGGERIFLSLLYASTVLVPLNVWLPTPNYNSLSLFALLLAAVWLVRVVRVEYFDRSSYVTNGLLLGVSGWVAFFSKPTVGVGLGFIAMLVILGESQKLSVRKVIRLLGAAFLLFLLLSWVSAVLISGSAHLFYEDLQSGLCFSKTLIGGDFSSITKILWNGSFGRVKLDLMDMLLLASISCSLVIESLSKQQLWFRLTKLQTLNRGLLLLLSCVGAIISGLVIFGCIDNPLRGIDGFSMFIVFWTPILATLLGLVISRKSSAKIRNLFYATLLLLFGYVYALGTSNNYFWVMRLLPIFGFASFLMLVSIEKKKFLVYCLGVFAFVISVLSLPYGNIKVYRQFQIDLKHEEVGLAKTDRGSFRNLHLHPEIKTYFEKLLILKMNSGFVNGTPVVDLTGASPGTVFAMGGQSVGAAWMLGGLSGSFEFAREKIGGVAKKEIDRAWLLTEDWERSIDADVLGVVQKNLHLDYTPVGTVVVPSGYGGRRMRSPQTLYKPNKLP